MKKIITTVLLILIFSCVLSLCSCNLFVKEKEHVLTKVEAVAPTCTTEGAGEHYICSGCDLLFDDAEGRFIINAPRVIPKKHNLTYVPADERVCKEGVIEHYLCSDCGGIFADEDGKQPLESAIHYGIHTPEIIPAKPSTCLENGHSAYRACKDCGHILTYPVALPKNHPINPTAKLTGVTMEIRNGRAYLVIYGGEVDSTCPLCNEDLPLKIAVDLQHNDNIDGKGWGSALVYADDNNFSDLITDNTVQMPAVEAKVAGKLFEAYFDITDLESGSTFTIHGGLDGAMADLKSQGNGNGVAVYANGKKFSFRLDSETWSIASVVVSNAIENEFNLNGRVNLEEIHYKPYLVYQGSWNTQNGRKEAVEAAIISGLKSKFDITEYKTWAMPEFDYLLEVNDDGSIKLALCLENLSASENVYYMHRALDNSDKDGNVKLPTGHDFSITVGSYKYTIVKGSDAASWLKNCTVIRVTEIATKEGVAE